MDFRLSEDQEALRDGIRSFCEGRIPVEALKDFEGAGFDSDLWRELAEMGVFGLRLPETEGGVGLGHADAVLVFSELGRRLVPGPVIWSHLAAGLIEGAIRGDVVVGGLDRIDPDGGPIVVEHLDSLGALLVLRSDGVFRVDPASLVGKPVTVPLDPLTPLHHVESLPDGDKIAGADEALELRRVGAALASGYALGICESTLELAVAYAKEREQFDRPIGSFQALKHIMADMFVRQEAARAAAYAGGATLDHPEVGDVDRAVAAAKICAGEGALKNARSCIQVHGGMGYTWEVPAHYYLKRACVLANVFGTAEDYASAVADSFDA
jgi:alkylation response protein AidB-like acyl-CoA dehydrogenase